MKRLCLNGALIVCLVATPVAAVAGARVGAAHFSGIALDVIPGCRLPVGVVSHSDQKEMPLALRDAVKQKLGNFLEAARICAISP